MARQPVTNRLHRAAVVALNHVPAPVAGAFGYDSRLGRLARPLVNRLVPRGVVPVVVRSGPAAGIKLLIDPQTEKFFWTGVHELPVQHALERLLHPGSTFWDVGAHAGFFTFLAARLVGAAGNVEAFEPMPGNRRRLAAAVELNGATNVRVHDYALSDRGGDATLFGSSASVTWSLVPDGGESEGVTVATRTLDSLARSLPLPDVLKVDAEGSELAVLRGGAELLRECRPAILLEADEEGVAAVRAAIPTYALERLDATHWLLRRSQ